MSQWHRASPGKPHAVRVKGTAKSGCVGQRLGADREHTTARELACPSESSDYRPASYTDPFGLCPECEDYWLDYAASGMARGGFAGGARAAVGIAAATGLEFFGVKDLWRAGSQASEGRYAAAGGSLLLTLGGVIPGERVAANFARTVKSAQGADVAVSTFGKFFRATWEVAGEGGGQSRTVWNKIINSEGKTIRMYHDSYDRAGNFMHRKFKVPDEHIAR